MGAAGTDYLPAKARLGFLSPRAWALVVFGAFVLPILVAIWTLPGFLVQDSPLYLYNSHLMLESLRPGSPFEEYLAFDWRPLPYWGAYAILGVLMPVLPPRTADQVLMTLTSVGVASGLMWLRWRVAGWKDAAIVAPLVILISINVLWMYGLYSFLLGAILYFITLAYWWRVRERMGARQAALLAALLIAGYFCHLVSFGLAAIGVVLLALLTPGPGLRGRIKWTALSLLPVVPLVLAYFRLMGAGDQGSIQWVGLTNLLSPRAWLEYLFMADFPTIQNVGMDGPGGSLIQWLLSIPPPSRWALIGMVLVVIGSTLRRSNADKEFYTLHRAWIVLAAVFLVGGAFGPSDIGSAQGFLRERVLLLGFATIVPVLRVTLNHVLTRTGVGLVTVAAILQVYLLCDYALKADRLVGEFMTAKPYVGTSKRIAAVMVNEEGHYRTGPLPHLPNMLGVDSRNLIWNNYGPALYYFPIKYRREDAKVLSTFFGIRLQHEDFITSGTRERALNAYRTMMAESHDAIEVLVMWSSTPELDLINRQWFEAQPVYENQRVKVFRHITD